MKKFLFILTLSLLCAGMSWAQNVIYVDPEASDGDLIVYNGVTGVAYSTCKAATEAASAGDTVRMLANITEAGVTTHPYTQGEAANKCCFIVNGYVFDGNGHSLKVTGSVSGGYGCAIYISGGTIKNLNVTGGFRVIFSGGCSSDINIDNCVIDAGSTGAYTFNSDGAGNCALNITNSTLKGWTSYTMGYASSTISNVNFDKCSYLDYGYYRPYIPTVCESCSFTSDVTVDASTPYRVNNNTGNPAGEGYILFNNCSYNGTALTESNVDNLLDHDWNPTNWHWSDGSETQGYLVPAEPMTTNANQEITGGVFSGDVDYLNSLCAPGYAAIPLGTTPETYRVTPVYYIHFNASGGTGTMESVYVPREAPKNVYTVPACTFTHTVPFKNWTTQPNGGGTDVAVDAVMTLTSDTTLYAKWSCVAMIGNTPYATLPEAITAATSGATITIVDNITPDAVANITLDKSLTITAETPGKYTIADHHFTLSGNTVEVTVSNLNFSGDSYINANNGKGLTVDHVNATVNPAKVPNNSRSAFIVLSTSENTTGLNFTLTNSNIVNTFGTDYSGAYVFGWAFLSSANISNNTFGSADYRCHFVAVKLMNVTDGTEYHFSDNTFYGTTDYYFAAFDLYQNNSRANSYTAWGENNVLDVEGTGPRKAYDIERNGNANAQIVVLDNGTTINGTPITTNDFENEIPVAQFNGYYAVDVEVSSTGKYMSGTYSTNVSGGLCAEGYAAFANGTDPETYTIAEAYTVKYDANKTPNQDTIIYIKKSVAEHTTLSANTYTNGELFFDGWNTQADGTGTDVAAGATMSLNSDTTLYAQWRGVAKIDNTHYLTLNAAAAAVPVGTPTTITILQNLNYYDIASSNLVNKTITFTGTATDTLTLTSPSILIPSSSGANLTFEGITLKNDMGEAYRGVQVEKITINDCEVIGFMNGYATTIICNNCTFTKTGKYHLWTYHSNCIFNNCTFNSYGNSDCKAVNVYSDQNYDLRVVTFNNCEFHSIPAVTTLKNSAIQINSQYTCFVVNINDCTVDGYINTESTVTGYENLVNNKTDPGSTTLYIDGVQLRQATCDPVAMIGDTYYGTLQGALDAAYGMTGDVTVNLIKDCAEDVTVSQKGGLNTTIDGNNRTLNGRIFVDGKRLFPTTDPGEVVITNLNFTYNDALTYIDDTKGFICNSKTNLSYAAHVTVSNCTFDGGADGVSFGMTAYRDPAGAQSWDITLDHLVAQNCHSLVQATSVSGLKVTHCKAIDNVKNGINISGGGSGHIPGVTNVFTIVEDTLTCNSSGEYSLRLQQLGYDATSINLSGNVFTATKSIVTKNNNTGDTVNITLNVSGGLYKGILSQEGTDHTHFSFTGGTFTEDVATVNTKCAPGYAAFDDEGSSPQTCTVVKMNMLTFNANGGTGTMDTVYLDPRTPQTYTVPACTFTYTGGIDFLAWNTKADGTGTSFDPDNNETITITSDTVLYAQWDYVAMIGETPYATLQAAVDAARASMTGDVIVKLLKDVTAYTLVRQKEGLDLTIDGQNHFLRGQIMIDGDGRSTGTDSLIIKNVKFEYDDGGFHASTPKAFVYFVKESGLIATSGHNYAHNVLVQNCSFNGLDRITNYPTYAVFSPNGQGGIYNITLDHLTATNVFTPALMNSTTNLTITHYTADEVTEGINIPGGTGNITLDYDTISAELYALRIRDNGTRVANIDNSQFVGANSILTGNSGTLNIAGGRYDGPLGYHTGYDADNDATVYSITGGTFNEDVTKKCAEGYAAFANGTTPETWTVYAAYKVKYVANNGTDASDSIYVRQSEGTIVIKECNYTNAGYTFLKWNKQADGSGSGVLPGVTYPLTTDVTFYAQWGLNLVYNVDQDIYYAALSTALNEANPGDTLRLLENLDLSNSVEFSQEQTLDLNTKTINSTVQYAVKATDGKVNIKNGTINSNKTYAVYCDGTAKLNIVDCNVNATQYTVVNNSTDTLTFTNGTIVNTYSSSGHYTIQNKRSGVIMVSGVTIPDGKNYLVDNVTTGTIKLNNHCNITGGDYVVRNNAADGKIYIDNSTITGTASYAYVVYPNNGGQMYISNSEINAPAGYCVYVGGSSSTPYVDINNCTLNAERRGIQNATIGRVDIHGNTTITLNSTNQAQYGVYQSTAGTLNVGGYIDENDNLVADGTVTITINPSISGTNCGAYVSNGVLNIFGNTNINAAGQYVSAGVICTGSTANISGGTITADNACILPSAGSTLIISDSVVLNAPNSAVKYGYNSGSNIINISGGTFNLTGDNAKGIYSANTSNKAKIAISGGTFNMAGNNANAFYLTGKDTVSVTGGTFTATGTNDTLFNTSGNGAVVTIDDITATASTLFNCGATDSLTVNGGIYNTDVDWLINAGKIYLNGGIFTSDNTTSAVNNGTLKVNKGWYSANMTSNTRSTKKYIARTGSEEPTYKDDAYLVPVDADAVTAASLTGTYYQLGNTITYHSNDGADNTLEQYKPIDESVTLLAEDAFTAPVMIAYWNTLANGTGTEYAPSSASPTTNADLDLYAQWKNVYNANTGRYYNNLQPAINAATAGDSLVILTDLALTYSIAIPKDLTINGNKHVITTTKDRGLWFDAENVTLKLKNFYFDGTGMDTYYQATRGIRAIQVDQNNVTLNMDSCRVYNVQEYPLYAFRDVENANVTVKNSILEGGHSAMRSYASNSQFNFINDTLHTNNPCTDNKEYATIYLEGNFEPALSQNNNISIEKCVIISEADGACEAKWLGIAFAAAHNQVTVDDETVIIDGDENDLTSEMDFWLGGGKNYVTIPLTSEQIEWVEDNDYTVTASSGASIVSAPVYWHRATDLPIDGHFKAMFIDFNSPFKNNWLKTNDTLDLDDDITMKRNDTTDINGDFRLNFKTYNITQGSYSIVLGDNATCTTDKQALELFSSLTGSNITETDNNDGTWTYSVTPYFWVTYNPNSGTGTIDNQVKPNGTPITLSDGTDGAGTYLFTKPDSTLYRWNTTPDEAAGSTNYALGAEYTDNANLDLYAVWRLNLNMTMDSTDVVCYGENNGTDTVKIIGGEAPFQIVLSSTVMAENDTVKNLMDRTHIFTNLKPGKYNVQLTDVLKKDTIRGTFTISQPDTLEITALTVPEDFPCPLMGSGSYDVSVTAQGGNGGYHYTWSEAAVNIDAAATTVVSGADDRDSIYTVKVVVTDSKNCTAEGIKTFTVSKVIADDGTVHSNSKLTIDTIRVGIMSGCDTVYKEYGTPVFTTTIPGGYPEDRLTIVNNIATAYPDSVFYLGENKIIWTATDTCGHSITGEQVLIVYHFPCPNVTDVDGNDYTSVRLGCDCWMAKNLRTSKYSDGRTVSNLMKYESPTHPDADANFAIYGYLYDWTAALDAENGVTTDAEGLVQGICPTGWHMPTDIDFMRIAGNGTVTDMFDLRYHGYWLDGGGDNSTGFSLLPGGFYNDNTARYENILGEAYLWSVNSADPSQPKVFWADCHCYMWQVGDPSANMGASVRCVKD